MVIVAVLVLAGCASSKYQGTKDVKAGPTFTETEKESMSDDEKLAIYNAQVREKDQVVCRRRVTTGSHRKRTVCFTRAERELQEDSARRTLNRSTGLVGAPADN
jgi:hypothetical protein